MLSDIGSDSLVIRLYDVDTPTGYLVDTIAVDREGKFCYALKNTTATWGIIFPFIRQATEEQMRNMPYVNIFLVKGEQQTVMGTMAHPQVEGTAFHNAYEQAMVPLDSMHAVASKIAEKYKALPDNEENQKACSEEIQAVSEKRRQLCLDYIGKNPDSDISTALIVELGMQHYDEGLALLTPSAREGRLSPLYKSGQRLMDKVKQEEQKQENMAGSPAPAFALPQPDGTLLTLEELRGKYVVLDFWGSWCGWCIKGIPDMKKAYEKHKDKVEFVSVDCRDTEQKWKDALQKYDMPWKHVRCDQQCDLPQQYHIQGYPTKVIIDAEGKVVKAITGESAEFYEYLDQLMK